MVIPTDGIVERVSGYSNEEMVDYCERLLRVSSKTLEVKSNNKTTISKKYVMPDGYNEYIKRSIDYYNQLIFHTMNNKISLRDYQENIADMAVDIINQYGFVYLAMEVRTGKTLTSLSICDRLDNVQNVLFITKKKAIKSITEDSDKLCPNYVLFIQNYESLHKLPNEKWDVIICDEAHTLGAFPKPSIRAKAVHDLIHKNKSRVILLSGTPTPESYSQMYHQVYGIPNNPFRNYKNFYRWCDDYVKVITKPINGNPIKDYSAASTKVLDVMAKYTISYTQQQAGFIVKTTEEIMYVDMEEKTLELISKLKKDLVIEGRSETILADTSVKLMQKLHQLYSGTVKFESGNSMVLDYSKAKFIKEQFDGKKIAIFYKFREELNALEEVFGDDLTTDLGVFEDTGKHIALQIVSGREGISLKQAECLVYYNIDFSATSYWQSRDRMTTKDRLENKVYWIFSREGIEKLIYKAVSKKRDYTINHFKKDLLLL
jgi:hypothetical protein